MEEIIILGKDIKQDIQNMPKKSLDISLIEYNKSDLTFFNIDEEETNETLKALKQSYVTTNYKEETILNLQTMLNSTKDNTPEEIKLESYKKYNNALDLASKNYITSALDNIEKALELNPKDVDILNLKGLLKLLKCDFSKSFESFYTAMCYGNNKLSRKYVDKLSSDEFNVFLRRYNHSIRFINEELNQESIHILDNIIEEDPDLIEPYVILALLYDKLNNTKKKDVYLEVLKQIDKDNPLIYDNNKEIKKDNNKKSKKSNVLIPVLVVGGLIFGIGGYLSINKIKSLNNQIEKQTIALNNQSKELDDKSEKLEQVNKDLIEANEEIKQKNEALEDAKVKEIMSSDEVTIYNHAIGLKKAGKYEEAIKYLKQIIKNGKTKKYISEAIYQVAFLSEKIKNYDDAYNYYGKYINTYTPEDEYYDDAFYQLGMLYYENGNLEKAKQTFYGLRSEVPNSIYNNSRVNEILNK